MRPATVIGTVTLSQADPAFRGARWLLVSPCGEAELTGKRAFSKASTPVVYDDLGAGIGDRVLFVDGAEAMAPFPRPIPLDAITVAILDHVTFEPITSA